MPKIHKVVTTVWYNKKNMHDLRMVFPDAQFCYVDFFDKEKLTAEVKDAEVAILLGDVEPCLLGENSLQWIHCDHAGLNGSARPEVFARGIPVTGAAGRSAPVLAEHCIYFMLQGCYHTKELLHAQENCQWGVDGMNRWRGLYGRTVGIVGMGNNGRMLADRLHAFGMKILAYDKFPIKGYEYLKAKYCAAFLVNMARGGIVCTEDLIDALRSGKLSGAGLDVFEEQPLSPESPLWKMENIYITPHTTPQVPDRAARSIEIIRENARRFENGEPLLNLMKPADAMNGEKASGGWTRVLNSKVPKEQIQMEMLEKFLGKRDWTTPEEWM